MDQLDEDELFTVCLDDDGHPVRRGAPICGCSVSNSMHCVPSKLRQCMRQTVSSVEARCSHTRR